MYVSVIIHLSDYILKKVCIRYNFLFCFFCMLVPHYTTWQTNVFKYWSYFSKSA